MHGRLDKVIRLLDTAEHALPVGRHHYAQLSYHILKRKQFKSLTCKYNRFYDLSRVTDGSRERSLTLILDHTALPTGPLVSLQCPCVRP